MAEVQIKFKKKLKKIVIIKMNENEMNKNSYIGILNNER